MTLPFNQYDVPPFSGKRYIENSTAAPKGTQSCGICGKPVRTDGHRHWAAVKVGGASWAKAEDDENDPGHMGHWPIRNDCHRKHHVPDDADAECTGCGRKFRSGTGHRDLPLCSSCTRRHGQK